VPEGLGTADDVRSTSNPSNPGSPAAQGPRSIPTLPGTGGSSSGGGAFDPVTGGLALGLAALGLLKRRQSHEQEK